MIFQDINILEKIGSLIFEFSKILLDVIEEQKNTKINVNQFRILNILRIKKAQKAVEIAGILGITEASVAKNIEVLADYNFLTKQENKNDKREKFLKITAKGKLKVITIGNTVIKKLKAYNDILSTEEKKLLLEILTKVESALDT